MSAEEKPVKPPPPIGFTLEGGGTVATCKRCGWELWRPTRSEAEARADDHKTCLAVNVALWKRLRKGIHAARRR